MANGTNGTNKLEPLTDDDKAAIHSILWSRSSPRAISAAQQQADQYVSRAPIYSAISNIVGPGAQALGAANQTAGQYAGDATARTTIPRAPIADTSALNRTLLQAQDAAQAVSTTPYAGTPATETLVDQSGLTPAMRAARQTAGQYGGYETVYGARPGESDVEVRRAMPVMPSAPVSQQPQVKRAEPVQKAPIGATPGTTETSGYDLNTREGMLAYLGVNDLTDGEQTKPETQTTDTSGASFLVPRTTQQTTTPEVRRAQPVSGEQQQQPGPEVRRAQPVDQQTEVRRAQPVTETGQQVQPAGTPKPAGSPAAQSTTTVDTGDYPAIKPILTGEPADMDKRIADFNKQKSDWQGQRYVSQDGRSILKNDNGTWVKVQPSEDGYGETWQYPDGRLVHREPTWTQHEKDLDSQLKGGDLATGKIYNLTQMTIPEKEYALQRNLTFQSTAPLDSSVGNVLTGTRNSIDEMEAIKSLLGKIDNEKLNKVAQSYLAAKAHFGSGYRGPEIDSNVAQLFARLDRLRTTTGNTLGLEVPKTDSRGVQIPLLSSARTLKGILPGIGMGVGIEAANKLLEAMTSSKYDVNNLRETIEQQINQAKRSYYDDVSNLSRGRWRVGTTANAPGAIANRYASELYKAGYGVNRSTSDIGEKPPYVSGPAKEEQGQYGRYFGGR
jgi:hypothetical protein